THRHRRQHDRRVGQRAPQVVSARVLSTLARRVTWGALAAGSIGAFYAVGLSLAADLPRPLPDQWVLSLWMGPLFSAPVIGWILLRSGVTAWVRGGLPEVLVGRALHEGCVAAVAVLGIALFLFDTAVGQSLFAIERARTGLGWVLEDVGLGVAGVLG